MKKEQNKLIFIPRTAHLHTSCFIQGDVILGELTNVKANAAINTQQNTIIIGANVNIQENVKITSYGPDGFTFICNQVNIGKGAHVCNSTIEDDVTVGHQAVVMDNCYIEKGVTIGSHTIITPHSRVSSNQTLEPNSVYSGNPAIKIATLNSSAQNINQAFRSPLFSQAI